ncbi:MAG: hypothetical protein HC905_26475 [Bacteroidales bacterium]|nr:hypothetical protein [Bacteroidales bacterium]
MQISKINVLGYQVYRNKINDIDITESKQVINTLNAYSYVVAKGDSEFRSALDASEILVADGFPVVLAAKLLRKVKINKIAGEDIFTGCYILRSKKT